jgi:hypothetical protein
MMSRAFAALHVGLFAILGGCGPSDPKIVVHGGAPVVVDPTPDKPGFDPRSARLRAAAREVEKVVGHPVLLHVDAALLSNDPRQFEETLSNAMVELAKSLDGVSHEDPLAFTSGTQKLEEVFARYEPLAREPRARFDTGGKRLVVELGQRPRELVPYFAVLNALLDAYDDTTEQKLSSTTPKSQTEIAERFAWLTRTRPGRGSVVVHRAGARASGESRAAVEREASADVRTTVIDLEGRVDDPELRTKIQTWLVAELPRIEFAKRDEKKLALLPRDSSVFRADRAYDAWASRRFWDLPEVLSMRLAEVLFPRGTACRGDEASCAKARALSGVERLDVGMKLLAEARAAGWDARKATHPDLVARIVCPSARDALGKPRETCNASFAAHALATTEGRKKLLDVVTSSRDARFASEVASTLGYASADDIRGYLRGLEGHPPLYKEAVRALVFGVWDHSRSVLEEETRRVWTTGQPDLRAATLTVLAESRGKLHRHYADGYFERFEREWGGRIDERTMGAFLDGSPRGFAGVPRLWKALEPSARVSPFLAGLDRFLTSPPEALDEPRTTTLEAVVARLCDDKATADLERVHRALEAAAQKSPELARSFGNAVDDSVPKRCPKKDPASDKGY